MSLYSDYVPDAVLDELRDMGYNVGVTRFNANETIHIENVLHSFEFYFSDPADGSTDAKRANKQNIKIIKALLNLY